MTDLYSKHIRCIETRLDNGDMLIRDSKIKCTLPSCEGCIFGEHELYCPIGTTTYAIQLVNDTKYKFPELFI